MQEVDIPLRNDAKFESFLNEVKPLFSKADWPYAKLDMAEAYYYNQFKDHKAFFKYAAANYNDDDNKIRYMAMYLKSPTEDAEGNGLFANWMQLVVNENSGTGGTNYCGCSPTTCGFIVWFPQII